MSRLTRRRALLAAALPAAAAAFALPPAAQAGTLSVASGHIGYTDTARTEPNDVVVRLVGDEIVITDPARIQHAGTRCRVLNLVEARCPSGGIDSVGVSTSGGTDTVRYQLPHEGFVDLGADDDTLLAGVREAGGRAIEPLFARGGAGHDLVSYRAADAGVVVDLADGLANDGRPGDREDLASDFEVLLGSEFADTLFGTPTPDVIAGAGGRDVLAGGGGDDLFQSYAGRDGADDYHGGPGRDTIDYFGRSEPLAVSLDNVANDGERGEGDNVRSNVENISGGSAGDVLDSLGAFSRLEGRGGDDFLFGGFGPDTLIGGPGVDSLDAGDGEDVVDSRDGQLDTVDCGTGADTLMRDGSERRVVGCESFQVGAMRLAPKAVRAGAGRPVHLRLRWQHPRAWRELRRIELRLYRDGAPVGEVAIRPRGQRIAADGAVALVRKASRLTAKGKRVSARLAIRPDRSLAGQTLKVEVEATDVRGRRQLEREAGTIRVAN